MPADKLTTIRLPDGLLDEADDLVPLLSELPEYRLLKGRVTRSTVLRMSLVLGIRTLAVELGADWAKDAKEFLDGRKRASDAA